MPTIGQVDQQLIERLRSRVYEYARAHPNEIDLADVRSRIPETYEESKGQGKVHPDLMLRRFLFFTKPPFDVEVALRKFVDFFTFRAKYGLAKMRVENTLPAEYFQMMPIIDQGVDRQGNKLLIGRLRFYRNLPQSNLIMKRAILFKTEQYDLQMENGHFSGLTVLFDLQGFNYFRDTNLELLHFSITIQAHYRGLINKALTYELPWAFNYLYKIFYSGLSKLLGINELSLFLINEGSIDEHIEKNQRPTFLNGTFIQTEATPTNVLPLDTMIERVSQELEIHIEKKNIRKMVDHMQQVILSN